LTVVVDMPITREVQDQLTSASDRLIHRRKAAVNLAFESNICSDPWDRFIEDAASKCYHFIQEVLGPYHKQPLFIIQAIRDSDHVAGANASFQPDNGQICLCPDYVRNRPGTTLEKLCHELLHANLNDFPEGDEFFEEGQIDYSTWVIAHAPYWREHREDMIEAAAHNIEVRRERALKQQTVYDRKRWAGGLCASIVHGPFILARLRQKKSTGDLTW
jgi:hypothetical protein